MKKFTSLLVAVCLPMLALANMNGGLHIDTWKIVLVLLGIPLAFITNMIMAAINVKKKSKALTIVNGIFAVPFTIIAVYMFKLSTDTAAILSVLIVIYIWLIWKSIPS